jgi:hypothetical protein
MTTDEDVFEGDSPNDSPRYYVRCNFCGRTFYADSTTPLCNVTTDGVTHTPSTCTLFGAMAKDETQFTDDEPEPPPSTTCLKPTGFCNACSEPTDFCIREPGHDGPCSSEPEPETNERLVFLDGDQEAMKLVAAWSTAWQMFVARYRDRLHIPGADARVLTFWPPRDPGFVVDIDDELAELWATVSGVYVDDVKRLAPILGANDLVHADGTVDRAALVFVDTSIRRPKR